MLRVGDRCHSKTTQRLECAKNLMRFVGKKIILSDPCGSRCMTLSISAMALSEYFNFSFSWLQMPSTCITNATQEMFRDMEISVFTDSAIAAEKRCAEYGLACDILVASCVQNF